MILVHLSFPNRSQVLKFVRLKLFALKSIHTLFILSLLFCSCTNEKSTNTPSGSEIDFEMQILDSAKSGIGFKNSLSPQMGTRNNLFDFDYYYNGAGVGIGDINNDGLEDIVFCGNEVENRMYLNLGDMKFKDITEISNINVGKNWSNGVTFVDINNDELLDIYVSQGGPYEESQRKNLLFINNGDLSFTEAAEKYGLADQGISTQSVFADFDQDGDLDCFVMNEAELFGYEAETFYQKCYFNEETTYYNTSHLYENIKGKFKNISKEAGIIKPTFGLGLFVSDLNNDNLPDIYVANDYFVPDAMYINQGQLKFTDEIKSRTNQITFYGMGADIGDINNDLKDDIIVLDMAARDHYRSKTLMASMNVNYFDVLTKKLNLHHQYMYNSLQLNDGTNNYNNIAQLSGISNTDWSWTPLLVDFDNDGYKDIYVTNGYRKYALDNDFKSKVIAAKQKYQGQIPLSLKEELYEQIPEEKLSNILYQNNRNLTFSDITSSSSIDIPTYSNGAAMGDLDNDGDIDIVVNNIDDNALVLENKSKANNWIQFRFENTDQALLSEVTIEYNGKEQSQRVMRVRGYMSSSQPLIHFGLENTELIDRVIIKHIDGTNQELMNVAINKSHLIPSISDNKNNAPSEQKSYFIAVDPSNIGLDYQHRENDFNDFKKETLLTHKQSSQGPAIKVIDLNNDQKEDVLIGGAKGYNTLLYTQNSTGTFAPKALNEKYKLIEDIAIDVLDYNNDEKPDIVIGGGGNSSTNRNAYTSRIYTANGSDYTANRLGIPDITGAVAHSDFDKDNSVDIIIGKRMKPHQYPLPSGSQLWSWKNKQWIDTRESICPELNSIGIIDDILVTDYNDDGWDDIIVTGEWSGIHLFKNDNGQLKREKTHLDSLVGWWNRIIETDINKDGLKDYVIGNLGLNSKYKASDEKKLKLYVSDFDKSGTVDFVLSKKYKDEYVPFRGKECSTGQMPFVSEKYGTYDLFAKATIEDVYGDLSDVYHREANIFESIILINKGKGKFKHEKLPKPAQITPIKDMIVLDINQDGYDDIIAVGNIYNTEVETPRLDYNSAIALVNNKKGAYNTISGAELGLKTNGNAKSIEKLNLNGKTYILIGINDGPMRMFQLK